MADLHSLNKGDKVRFLNEKGEGIISRVDKKYAHVLVTEGFEIPVLPSEIVVVEKAGAVTKTIPAHNSSFQVNYNYAEREDDDFTTGEEHEKAKEGLTSELFLAFVKQESRIELYLINTGDYYVYYHVAAVHTQGMSFVDAGKLEPGMQALLDEKEQGRAEEWGDLRVNGMEFHPLQNEVIPVVEKKIHVGSRLILNDVFKSSDFFDEPAVVLNLHDKNPQIAIPKIETGNLLAEKEAEDEDKSQRFKKRPEKETVEVDLHIEKLIDNFKGMSNHEMLTFQMNHFRKELENALKNKDRISRIVFIHGIGNGTLKLQLRKQLDDMYSFLYYQDASFAEYGFGATMVMLDRIRK